MLRITTKQKGRLMFRIQSLLSARLFLAPQLSGQRIYFISNLSGRMSLFVMDYGGSVPEPLLPPNLAMQNPELTEGTRSFYAFPGLGKILVMLDQDGDENYQPMWIPLEGGFPEPAFGGALAAYRNHLVLVTPDEQYVYLLSESREAEKAFSFRVHLATGELVQLTESKWTSGPAASSADQCQVVIFENYTMGDSVLYLWQEGQNGLRLLHGVPLDQRQPGQVVPPSGINSLEFTPDERGLLLTCAVFTDTYGPAYLDFDNPQAGFKEVKMEGLVHQGSGELVMLRALKDDHFSVEFNIDGCSWLYEAVFDRPSLTLKLEHVVAGGRRR